MSEKGNSPNVLTRGQQGGTCWFQAIINGLLMSPKSRRILQTIMPITNNNSNNSNSCPSRSASGRLFWSYVRHRLSGQGSISPRYVNKNVIRNFGLRRSGFLPNIGSIVPRIGNTKRSYRSRLASARSGMFGGSFADFRNVYDKLFPGDWSSVSENRSTTFVVVKKGNYMNDFIKHRGELYVLSHAYIEVMLPFKISGHAMTGYISRNGNPMIYDSGFNRYFPLDWKSREKSDTVLINYIREGYSARVTKVHKWGVYVKNV